MTLLRVLAWPVLPPGVNEFDRWQVYVLGVVFWLIAVAAVTAFAVELLRPRGRHHRRWP